MNTVGPDLVEGSLFIVLGEDMSVLRSNIDVIGILVCVVGLIDKLGLR